MTMSGRLDVHKDAVNYVKIKEEVNEAGDGMCCGICSKWFSSFEACVNHAATEHAVSYLARNSSELTVPQTHLNYYDLVATAKLEIDEDNLDLGSDAKVITNGFVEIKSEDIPQQVEVTVNAIDKTGSKTGDHYILTSERVDQDSTMALHHAGPEANTELWTLTNRDIDRTESFIKAEIENSLPLVVPSRKTIECDEKVEFEAQGSVEIKNEPSEEIVTKGHEIEKVYIKEEKESRIEFIYVDTSRTKKSSAAEDIREHRSKTKLEKQLQKPNGLDQRQLTHAEPTKELTTESYRTVKKTTTNAERCREYREKKKSKRVVHKTEASKALWRKSKSAERSKRYRERQKLRKMEYQQHNCHSSLGTSAGTSRNKKRTPAEYMRDYRHKLKLKKQRQQLNDLEQTQRTSDTSVKELPLDESFPSETVELPQLREEITALLDRGLCLHGIARELSISVNTVKKCAERHNEKYVIEDKRRYNNGNRSLTTKQLNEMQRQFEQDPFTSTRYFAIKYGVSQCTIRNYLHSAGLHYERKKN